MNIIYFGKPYSFTHISAIRRFGEEHNFIPRETITDVIETLMNQKKSISVIPVENSTAGIIHDTVDVLTTEKYINAKLVILEELELLVKLFLLSKKQIDLSEIRKIYSHEYALKRSEPWIKKYMPLAEPKQSTSTSEAVCKALKEKYSCAIASSEAAKYYGLRTLKEITVNGIRNLTKFLVIGNKNFLSNNRNKEYRTTIVFSLKDRIGALCDALKPFKKYNINLTRIISRPDIKKEWQYKFFIEIKGDAKNVYVRKALEELKKYITNIYNLGSYPLISIE